MNPIAMPAAAIEQFTKYTNAINAATAERMAFVRGVAMALNVPENYELVFKSMTFEPRKEDTNVPAT